MDRKKVHIYDTLSGKYTDVVIKSTTKRKSVMIYVLL